MRLYRLVLIIMILSCGRLISQENYKNFRVVTWIEIQDLDYTVISKEGDITVLMINGEMVIVKNS